MDAEGSLHQKPNESDVMDAEGSLYQKQREVCITEDTESIDLEWFENTKLNRVKNGTRCLLQVGVRDWESLGTSPSRIQRGFGETVAEVMDADVEGEDEIHRSNKVHEWRNESLYTSRPGSSHRISVLTSMNTFAQVRILLLLQFTEDREIIQRAAVRRR